MTAQVTMGKVMESLELVMETLGNMNNRLAALESPKVTKSNGNGNKNGRKTVLKPTTMPRGNFLKTASAVFKPVADNKTPYNRVEAYYSFDNKKTWTRKIFWGRKKMAKHDWAMWKLHGEFSKRLDA